MFNGITKLFSGLIMGQNLGDSYSQNMLNHHGVWLGSQFLHKILLDLRQILNSSRIMVGPKGCQHACGLIHKKAFKALLRTFNCEWMHLEQILI